MNWHPNKAKHKATHRGYKSKPTKSQVNALLDLYSGSDPEEKNVNKQLDLFA